MKKMHLPSFHLVLMKCLMAIAGFGFIGVGNFAKANGPAPDRATSEYEVRFMEEMIDHHAMAVRMGQMCLAKAVHQELRAMCQDMVTSQQQEIVTMQQWLAAWYGLSNYQPEMSPGHMERMERMTTLSGAEFEIEFMQQMIQHHKLAVVKASQCIARAYHDPLQQMCTGIVTSQLTEIRQMEQWLCNW